MALEREVHYQIKNPPNDHTITVDAYASLKLIKLSQSNGDYHNEKTETIRVSFAQLEELIVALEELRTKYVPREYSPD